MFTSSFRPASALRSSNPILHTLRLRHKVNKQPAEKPPTKAAADVVKYLESTPEYAGLMEKLPKALLRKYKAPESMYLINRKTAKEIASAIRPHLDGSPVVEVNPGLGLLSEELLKIHHTQHYMYEISSHFTPYLENLKKQHPNRVSYKIADFFGMWKLAFKDKMDEGHRVKELLGDLSTEDNERIVKIVGSMPGLSFMKHLIYTIVFHNAASQLGRPDLFITMPVHRFEFLTDSDVQLSKHKSIPALFQTLFDFKVLTSVPNVHFLPWTHPTASIKNPLIDEYQLYLVNITQKAQLPCPPEYLPLLWYFFKPHVFSRSTRIIPMLEQWIPGCGVWLITGQDPPDTKKQLTPGPDDAPLPHMTIFTEFGDLNLKQKITVFKKECAWELYDLTPSSSFHLRSTERRLEFHPYMVDLPPIRTKRFASTFAMRTAKEWNFLPADVFPEHYNLGLFKARVNRHLLGKYGPLLTASSLNIRFISWPEFEHCQFRTTMENNLPKSVSQIEHDDKDPIIGTHIEDLDHSDSETES